MQGKTFDDTGLSTPREAAADVRPESAAQDGMAARTQPSADSVAASAPTGERRKAKADFSGRLVLDLLPQLDRVKVKVGGVPVPRDPRHAHGYDILVSGAAVTIVFYGYYKPRKGETVTVEYEHQEY